MASDRETGAAWIIDVGDADFVREVVARSHDTPVVVDFWAPWCAPCRVLAPVLERLVEEYEGRVVLAKVNVDEAPEISARMGIRGIPAVKGFRAGGLVAEFTGVQPEHTIRQFIEAVLPTAADTAAAAGAAAVAAGDLATAETRFRESLALDAHHGGALLALARLLGARGDLEEALDLIDRILPSAPQFEEGERLAAELRTRAAPADGPGDEAALRARLQASPEDIEARLDLGRLLAARKDYEAGLAELLRAVKQDPHYDDDAGRRAMLDVFTLLGTDHPLTQRFRGELAKVLYS